MVVSPPKVQQRRIKFVSELDPTGGTLLFS